MTQKSSERLAVVLEQAGLAEIARKARADFYHDYLSPFSLPSLELANDLQRVGTPAALAIRERHMNGEFDATKEEGDEWVKGEEGQELMSHLPPHMRRILGG